MSRTVQKGIANGSLKDIRILINKNPDLLNKLICSKLTKILPANIEWVSPIASDDFAEYSDNGFITQLGLSLKTELVDFWPVRGAHWDALGRSETGEVFIVEAKANIPEIVSTGTKATSKKSLELIHKSLNETKTFLNINNDVDWSANFYQYTNRIAHLYFLREINNIPAYLVNIYFINDKSVNGPTSLAEWEGAIKVMKCHLGANKHKLSKYMIDIFVDVNYL